MIETAPNTDALCDRDFARVRKVVYSELGIHLSEEKRTMLEGRLRKRVRALNLSSFADYCVYLFSSEGQREEIPYLLDVVTTNKTDFFRESRHFDFLTATALPRIHRANRDPRGPLLWSAGCSTGEEPYTLAIVLQEFAEQHP
jgi:chemotaxis protein methyltransferase CheR